jgi:hypothetical protein
MSKSPPAKFSKHLEVKRVKFFWRVAPAMLNKLLVLQSTKLFEKYNAGNKARYCT